MQRLPAACGLVVLLLAACGTASWSDRLQEARRQVDWTPPREAEAGPDEPAPSPHDLAGFLALAETRNPGLDAAWQRWQAALARAPQVDALPEPRLGLGVFLNEVETRVGPMQARVSLTQTVPWFGKLDAASQAALLAAEASREEFEAARLDLRRDVRVAWYELAWLVRAIQVSEEHLELLRYLESSTRARYETAGASHADLIRVQVEISELDDRLRTLRDLRHPMVAQLNALAGRATTTEVTDPEGVLPVPPAQDVQDAAELDRRNPSLRRLHFLQLAAEEQTRRAEKEFWPDFQVGLDYTFIGDAPVAGVPGSGDDALALTFGVELPIWRSRYRAGIAQGQAMQAARGAELADARNRLLAELERARYELRDAHRRVELYENDLVPKAEESLQALLAGYQATETDFLDVIDAERLFLEFQLAAVRARADRLQAWSEIDRIVGRRERDEP